MSDKTLISKLNTRKGSMKVERSSFEPYWRDISDYISTKSSRYLRSSVNRGDKVSQKIINETATTALRTLESGMMAGMASPARPWFTLAPPDPDMKSFGPVKNWLSTVTKIMLESFARSNLYSALPKAFSSIGAYGTQAFGILEDEKEIFRCYPFPIGSFLIDCNERLNVDACYREFSMTVRQLIEKFGEYDQKTGQAKWDLFSPAVKTAWDASNYGTWIPVTHAVEPNHFRDDESLQAKHKPYMSVYYEDSMNEKALRISGFDEFPIMASRWHVNGEDVYGSRCPGMDALGSVRMLQLEERRKYQIIDKMWNPPMNADSTMRNVGADLLPGGLNWTPGMSVNGYPGLRPAQEMRPQAVEVLRNDIIEVQNRIRRTFYEDLMLMFATGDNTQKTAREVEERHSEKLLVLGPMMEQQNDDLFDPLIDRTFNALLRRGKFPKPPPELEGGALRVEYVSIMAQAQKLIGVSSIDRFVGFVSQTGAVFGTPSDKVNRDALEEEYANLTGVASNVIFTDEQVQATREQRAKEVQAAQTAERMPSLAAGAQAAKAMSETDMTSDNALTRMMNQMTG